MKDGLWTEAVTEWWPIGANMPMGRPPAQRSADIFGFAEFTLYANTTEP